MRVDIQFFENPSASRTTYSYFFLIFNFNLVFCTGDAASYYLKAWALSGQRDPVLGYRLGMFFLKSKRYADAISTCQAVLKKVPDNTKIKKDIYEKSLSLLRT